MVRNLIVLHRFSFPFLMHVVSQTNVLNGVRNFKNFDFGLNLALREGAAWEGRSCCALAQTPLCQVSCVTAAESADIQRGCRRSDEPALYNCLQRQNVN